jgi:hypothetical protein
VTMKSSILWYVTPCNQPTLSAAYFMFFSCLAYTSVVKTEATIFSETSIDIHRTTWCYVTEGIIKLPANCTVLFVTLLYSVMAFLFTLKYIHVDECSLQFQILFCLRSVLSISSHLLLGYPSGLLFFI